MSALGPILACWLRENQQADGRILDPVHQEHGLYADGFACLAFGLMALRTGDPAWTRRCNASLKVARRRPRDAEFDQLALLLLANEAQNAGSEGRPLFSDDGPCVAGAERVALYRGRRLVSNNWVAMRAFNYALRARLTGSHADRKEAARLWKQVLAWQRPDGLFIDSPGGDATPVTYHAKFCAMLALALAETEFTSDSMQSAFRRGLDALAPLVSPSGVLVPYGRSRNTLFGYAAAILAFRLGSRLLDQPAHDELSRRLEGRVRRFQRPDGHVPCVLNDGEAEKQDWDVYVNNPDYNAYAAALLMLADQVCGRNRPPSHGGRSDDAAGDRPPLVAQVGPILTVQQGGLFAAFSTFGQAVPRGTPFFCDHRYYGMQPLWIEQDGRVLLEPTPYRWRGTEDRSCLVDPAADPWIPGVGIGQRRYYVRRYDRVQIRQNRDRVEIEADGQLENYRPVPRWRRGLSRVLYRWMPRPGAVFCSCPLPGVRLRRSIGWSPHEAKLQTATELAGSLPPGFLLHRGEGSWSAAASGAAAPSQPVPCR